MASEPDDLGDLADSVDELQKIAEYRRGRNILRKLGIGGIVFGAINLLVGVPLVAVNPINLILVLIGFLLLVDGICNVVYPTAEGILVDGADFVLVGLWNLAVTVINGMAAAVPDVHWAVIGVFQLGWAVYRFASYPRFHRAFRERPDPDDVRLMDDLVRKLLKADPKKSPDVITFRAKSFLKEQNWKGQLSGGAALFAEPVGHEVLVARKEDVTVTVRGKVLLGKTLKASIRVKDRTLDGLIGPNSVAKYTAWKEAGERPIVVEPADEDSPAE